MIDNCPIDVSSRNIDAAIEFLLVFLADVPNSYINGSRLNEVLGKVGALVGDILCIIQKHFPGSTIGDDSSEINLGSIQILEKIEDLKAQVFLQKFVPGEFPTVGGLSFLDSVVRKLNEMKSESGSDFIMKSPHIVVLEKELSSLTSVFRDAAKVPHNHEIYKDLQRRTVCLGYEAEIAVDSILCQSNCLWHFFFSLPAIIKELKHITGEVPKIWSESHSPKLGFMVEPSKYLPTQHRIPMNGEDIVGFESDTAEVIKYLIQGSNELDVIPIVGMGGQGKTTFARKLYNDETIVSRFDARAWCCVSQTYTRYALLKEIFHQVSGSNDEDDKVDELADKLRKILMCERYLIVLDDMWEVMAWDEISSSFPDVKGGSRIIVTTRLEKVGEHVKHSTDPYLLPPLTLEKSRELLRKKVFQNEGCPPELDEVSEAVAERCRGLPLVIVLVAGILKRNKMEDSWWHEVKDSLLSYLGECEGYSLSTMQLSYENLPHHLRPFLLYMGMFPEDERILVSKLIRLWIAEGFVQTSESGRLEEAAEGYLNDLISSNVVMASKRWHDGKPKYCQVHDVVLHFCLEKSREEKFMSASKGHSIQFRHSDMNENRLCYHDTDNEPSMSEILLCSKTRKPFHQDMRMRSLIIYASVEYPLKWFTKFSLLKILDLSSYYTCFFSLATLHPLIHLRYLAADVNKLNFNPGSQLRHLETVIVMNSQDVLLPESFWKMKNLRHVEFEHSMLENNEGGTFEESSKLENLSILRGVELSRNDDDCMDVLLQRCPNLQELGITVASFDDNDPPPKNWTYSGNFEGFAQLQSLDIGFYCSYDFQLPLNLKKLKLHTHRMTTSVVSMIAKLPSLEYLKLGNSDFDQEEWNVGDITFLKLKFLKLLHLGISTWFASEESFPQLETLVIKGCDLLDHIPFSFAYIDTLKQIELSWYWKDSLKDSATEIKKEAEDMRGVDSLHLFIH